MRLTEEQIEKIQALVAEGKSFAQVASKVGCCKGTVYRWASPNAQVRLLEQQRRRIDSPIGRAKHSLQGAKNYSERAGTSPCNATPQELVARLFAQDFKCAVCGYDERETGIKLCMDHCHNNGKFRGWLCRICNRVAGAYDQNTKAFNDYFGAPNE